jgi:hypothetical protein
MWVRDMSFVFCAGGPSQEFELPIEGRKIGPEKELRMPFSASK